MSGRGARHKPDRVERYLRRLSWWAPRACRRDLVMEAARHLYEATRRAEDEGVSHEAAQRAALRAFGPAWRIGLAARGLDAHPLLDAARLFGRRMTSPRLLRQAHRLRLPRRPRLRRP